MDKEAPGDYRALSRDAYGHLARDGIMGGLVVSLLLHGLLIGLPMALMAGTVAKKRKLTLTTASRTAPTFNVTLKSRRPPAPVTPRGRKPAESGGGEKKPLSRFNSDVISKHRRSIEGSIIYPRVARRMGWQGRVRVRVVVGPNGNVMSVKVITSSGYPVLDRAALNGVSKHRFEAGESTETFSLSLRFQLAGE